MNLRRFFRYQVLYIGLTETANRYTLTPFLFKIDYKCYEIIRVYQSIYNESRDIYL